MSDTQSNRKTKQPGTSGERKQKEKAKFPLKLARGLATKIVEFLEPHTERILIAGSIRREKPLVGDIEILYIPKWQDVPDPNDLFGESKPIKVECVDEALKDKFEAGILARRENCGWGEKNKHAVHVPTGIPIDFFATDILCWHNYLVCRTGPGESNVNIASLAKKKGWRWQPYGRGFVALDRMGQPDEKEGFHPVSSEAAVFSFVGLECPAPKDRR